MAGDAEEARFPDGLARVEDLVAANGNSITAIEFRPCSTTPSSMESVFVGTGTAARMVGPAR